MHQGGFDESLVDFVAFHICKSVNISKMQGAGHTVFHALRITAAQVALCRNMPVIFIMHASERTGKHTHFAADTQRLVDNNGTGNWIASDGLGRTYLQAGRLFTLQAGDGENRSVIHINLDPDVRILAIKATSLLKRANSFTIAACQAAVFFDKYDLH
jgi:hypothetical protein